MRQFAVIGLGRFGYQMAETLAKKGASVIAIVSNDVKHETIKYL